MIVIAHMLKWDYQPGKRTAGWARSIAEHRARLRRALLENPSYNSRIVEAIERSYERARRLAAKDTKLALATFPISCPFTWEEIVEREPFDRPIEDNRDG